MKHLFSVSVTARHIKPMTSAQDHKRAKDGDKGLNTGGMGTFSPSPFYTDEVNRILQKTYLSADNGCHESRGQRFYRYYYSVGLMLTEDGPKVLEYNARFGDPEAQVVLPRMKNDIIDVMDACIDGRLRSRSNLPLRTMRQYALFLHLTVIR